MWLKIEKFINDVSNHFLMEPLEKILTELNLTPDSKVSNLFDFLKINRLIRQADIDRFGVARLELIVPKGEGIGYVTEANKFLMEDPPQERERYIIREPGPTDRNCAWPEFSSDVSSGRKLLNDMMRWIVGFGYARDTEFDGFNVSVKAGENEHDTLVISNLSLKSAYSKRIFSRFAEGIYGAYLKNAVTHINH